MAMINSLLKQDLQRDMGRACRFHGMATRLVMVGLAVLAAVPCHAQGVGAVQIEGRVDDMRVRLENAPIAQVLADLGRRFSLRYGRVPSVNRSLTGRYSGNLTQVLARILDGTDYILEFSDQSVTLVVLGVSAPAVRVAPTPVASAPQKEPSPPSNSAPDRVANPAAPASPAAGQVPPLSSFLPDNTQRPASR